MKQVHLLFTILLPPAVRLDLDKLGVKNTPNILMT